MGKIKCALYEYGLPYPPCQHQNKKISANKWLAEYEQVLGFLGFRSPSRKKKEVFQAPTAAEVETSAPVVNTTASTKTAWPPET